MRVFDKFGSTVGSRGLAAAFVLCLALFCFLESASAAEDIYLPLKKRLVQDGFSAHEASRLFQSAPAPLFKVVAKTFTLRESKLNYDQFLDPAAVSRAVRFARDYSSTLSRAEAAYGVDRSVIVGILLVETQFGSYTGRTSTLAVFSTFALMDNEKYRNRIWALLSADERRRWGREAFNEKLKARAEWAYKELCALVRLEESPVYPIESFRGSVMGAVGLPQFLPSSLVRYGADGNRDGRIDLYDPEDAIFSVANYLRGYGWCQARTRAQKEDVIHNYNKSRPYVEAVLGVADRVRERM